ncbi:MAG: ABC transporter substrate-binding protein [Alphaproteobacteria bacterium]
MLNLILNHRRKFIALSVAAFAIVALFSTFNQTSAATKKTVIAIGRIVSHPSLNEIERGIVDALAERAYVDGETCQIVSADAHGSIATATVIAHKFKSLDPDLVIPIATPMAQSFASIIKTPMVFAAVTDPLAARLVESLEKPGKNITGMMDMQPVAKQIAMVHQLMPELKTLGVVYNPGEINSVKVNEAISKIAEETDLTVVFSPASKTCDVSTAASLLIGQVDAVFLTIDNTVISAVDSLLKITRPSKVPVFPSDSNTVFKQGAVAALAFDQYEMGKEIGQMAADVLESGEIGPVRQPESLKYYLNTQEAGIMGIQAPDSVAFVTKN